MITLEALQTLDSIDRNGSFSAAAEELHRVPSAVSYTIQRLEEGLGVKLFDRKKQRAVLTPTGQLVLKHGRNLLQAADNLSALAKQTESGWEPRLRIMVDTILPMAPLYPLIEEFQQEQPAIEVELFEEALSGSWEALAEQRADLAIGMSGEPPTDLQINFVALGSHESVLAAAPKHPAAQQQGEGDTNTESLRQFTQVIIKDSARHFRRRSVGLLGGTSNLFVDTYQRKEEAILAGLGIGFLPKYRIQHHLNTGAIVDLKAQFPKSSDMMKLVWRRENQGKALEWFVEKLTRSSPYKEYLEYSP